MSFNFGSQRGFGSPATGASGTGFGFGATTPGFGQPAQQSTAFGAPNQGQTSVFGSGTGATGLGGAKFGATPSSTPGGFGGFGGTGFGSGTATGFGAATGTGNAGFGSQPGTGTGFGAASGTGGSLFGTPNTTPGFGAANTAGTGASPFGAATSGAAFGGTSGGAFGSTVGSSTGAFGTTPAFGTGGTTPFGTATAFGATPTQSSPFGNTNSTWGSGGLGARAAQPGTGNPPYKPTVQSDTNGTSHIEAITAMDAYKEKSFEELRWEDYQRGNTKGSAGASPLGGGFGLASGGGTGAFGATSSFGTSSAAPAGTGFGFGASPGLGTGTGTTTSTTGFGGFGAQGSTGSTGGFGATGSSAFGASTFGSTQTRPAFGASPGFGATTSGTFGGTGTTSSLFGQSTTPQTGGFGSGTGSAFGTGQTGFGSATTPAPAPSPFGATTPTPSLGTSTFGGMGGAGGIGGGFGSATGTATGGLGFGSSAFGASAKTSSPGFGTANTSLSTGFGTPGQANKPFGAFGTQPGATSSFSTPSLFSTPQASSFSTGFGKPTSSAAGATGFSSFGASTGLGGTSSPFGATPGFGLQNQATNFAIGGNSMQSALQQSQVQQSMGQFTPAPQQHSPFTMMTPGFGSTMATSSMMGSLGVDHMQKPLLIRVGSSGKKTTGTRRRAESTDETPPTLQSYRYTPRSAAKITPRGMRQQQPLGEAGDAEDDGGLVSPGTDSFSVRSHKNLDLSMGNEDIFTAESKIFELEDREEVDGDSHGLMPALSLGGGMASTGRDDGGSRSVSMRLGALEAASKTATPLSSSSRPWGSGGEVETKGVPPRSNMGLLNASPGVLGRAPTLTKSGYRSEPPLHELQGMNSEQLRRVRGFKVIHEGVGQIAWEGETDVEGLDLDAIVTINEKEVHVYGDGEPSGEPEHPLGQKLNKPAIVTLDRVLSKKRSPEAFRAYLMDAVQKWDGAEFLSYDTDTGRWQFRVAHFSKYAIDEDEDDEEEAKDARGNLISPAQRNASRWQRSVVPVDVKRRAYGAGESDEEITDKDEEVEHMDVAEGSGADENPAPLGEGYGLAHEKVKSLAGLFGGEYDKEFEEIGGTTVAPPRPRTTAQERLVLQLRSRQVVLPEQHRESSFLANEEAKVPLIEPRQQASWERKQRQQHTLVIGPSGLRRRGLLVLGPTVPMKGKTLGNTSVDYASFLGQSFRVGWGPGGTLAIVKNGPGATDDGIIHISLQKTLGTQWLSERTTMLEIHKAASSSSASLERLEISDSWSLPQVSTSSSPLDAYLAVVHKAVHGFIEAGRLARAEPSVFTVGRLWALVNALWGQETLGTTRRPLPVRGAIGERFADNLLERYGCEAWTLKDVERRKQAFARWLKETVRSDRPVLKASPDEDQNLQTILELLRTYRLKDAAKLATESGFLRLSLLIPLAGQQPHAELVADQLRTSDALNPHETLVEIYNLLGGEDKKTQHTGLDWTQSLGLYLWYDLRDSQRPSEEHQTDPLLRALDAFANFSPVEPIPSWGNQHPVQDGVRSVFYNLLELYRNEHSTEDFRKALDPRGMTPDWSDFLQSWLLMTILDALGVGPGGDMELRMQVTSGLVFQLTAVGLWEWAVYVLLHVHPDHLEAGIRTRLVKELICRHGGLEEVEQEGSRLIRELVPMEWLNEARALRLRNEGSLFALEADRHEDHALGRAFKARAWPFAHEILMNVAGPALMVQDRHSDLLSLLTKLAEHAEDIETWATQGKACLGYLKLRHSDHAADASSPYATLENVLLKFKGEKSLDWAAQFLNRAEAGLYLDQAEVDALASQVDGLPNCLQASRHTIFSELHVLGSRNQRLITHTDDEMAKMAQQFMVSHDYRAKELERATMAYCHV